MLQCYNLATVLRRFSNIKVTPRGSSQPDMNYLSLSDTDIRSKICQQKSMITLLHNLPSCRLQKEKIRCALMSIWSRNFIAYSVWHRQYKPSHFTLILRWSSLNSWVEPEEHPRKNHGRSSPIRHSLRLFLFAHHIRSNFHRHSLVSWVVARRCLLLGMFVVQLSSPKT